MKGGRRPVCEETLFVYRANYFPEGFTLAR